MQSIDFVVLFWMIAIFVGLSCWFNDPTYEFLIGLFLHYIKNESNLGTFIFTALYSFVPLSKQDRMEWGANLGFHTRAHPRPTTTYSPHHTWERVETRAPRSVVSSTWQVHQCVDTRTSHRSQWTATRQGRGRGEGPDRTRIVLRWSSSTRIQCPVTMGYFRARNPVGFSIALNNTHAGFIPRQ